MCPYTHERSHTIHATYTSAHTKFKKNYFKKILKIPEITKGMSYHQEEMENVEIRLNKTTIRMSFLNYERRDQKLFHPTTLVDPGWQ